MYVRLVAVAPVALLLLACSGAGHASSPASPAASASAAPVPAQAGDAGAGEGGAPERPFAGSIGEATQLIDAAVDRRQAEMKRCVVDYRTRKKIPRAKVSLSLGIDQEGRLLGVTLPKGKKDEQLAGCVQDALKGVVFPRSHAGVITVTKTYEEILQ